MGNAIANSALNRVERAEIIAALTTSLGSADDLVREHIQWALQAEPTI
jgi:epoxyqueuosine reductase QueG